MLHLDLVDDLNGDFLAALLLDRIRYRAGDGWWAVTRADMLADTRMSEYQLKRSLRVLRDAGYVETERVSAYDATLQYRVVLAENVAIPEVADSAVSTSRISPPEVANIAVSEMANIAVSTSSKNSEELSLEHAEEKPRPDVEHVCNLLADRIVENGGNRPTITKRWRDSARLMIDKDRIPVDQIVGAINWSQANDFWKANILSFPKLREKYNQLRLNAEREHHPTNVQAHLALVKEMWENEPSFYPELEG